MKESYVMYKDKLKGEYRETFEKIEMYVRAKLTDEPMLEERLLQITDALIAAQSDGKPCERVVGKDIEKFCQTFCSDIGAKNKLWRVLDSMKVVVIFELIGVFFGFMGADLSKTGFFGVKSESEILNFIPAFVLCILLCDLAGFLITSLMFKTKKLSVRAFKWIWYSVAAISAIVAFWLVMLEPFGSVELPLWVVGAACTVYLPVYAVLTAVRRARDTRKKVSVFETMEYEKNSAFSNEMDKIFESRNRKRIKKGKTPLSMNEFLLMQEKECEKMERSRIFYMLLPLIVCPAAIFLTEFESLRDEVLFAVVQFAVQYALMYGMWRLVKNSTAVRRKWIEGKRNEMTALDDAEE